MSNVESLGGSMVKLSLEISAEDFEKAIRDVYNKQKKQISIPGFRKGKVPYQMVIRMYGKEVFYDDALNEILPDAYAKAVEEEGLEVMSRPTPSLDGEIKEGEPIKVNFEVAIKPEVTLGEYKGLKKDQEPVEVTDEDVQAELERVQNQNARKIDVTDRAAQMDDTVNIDYLGTVDGEAFDGGQAEGYDLKLGSHSFIDTFEDQIVGKNIGENFDVNVTFPAEYHAADLAGKAAVFNVTLNSIKADEKPELDDEFAKDVSEFDTLDEYKEDLKKNLLERKQKQAEADLKNKLLDQVVEGASMDMPAPMVDEQVEEMYNEYAQNMRYQGIDMEQYMKYTGTTRESLLETIRPDAERRLKENLVLEAIAKAESLEASEEDIDAEITRMAEMYGMEKDKLTENITESMRKDIAASLLNTKALDFLVENAID
ncbi:MAG: trigger factor [Firmicutes bacterium]|nr:trigger factor [Bacillota bacterium]